MNTVKIIGLNSSNIDHLVSLNAALFEGVNNEQEKVFFEKMIDSFADQCFLAYQFDTPIGFLHVSLRYEYVEGTDEGPTAYLEAIYVLPDFRGIGVASLLLAHAEAWALERGVTVLASDTELHNAAGIQFHESHGFEEANRIICYTKKLDTQS